LHVIIIVGFLLKTSSNDDNFIPKIFIDLEQFSVKEKNEKCGRLIHWNKWSTEFSLSNSALLGYLVLSF
jgi:hypothetical protein